MHFNPHGVVAFAVAQLVEAADDILFDTLLKHFNYLLGVERIGAIKQAREGSIHERTSAEKNVDSSGDRDDRIDPENSGEVNDSNADDDGCAGPHVSEDVFTVGDEDDGILLLAHSDEKEAQGEIDECERARNGDAPGELLELGAFDEGEGRFVDDVERGEEDKRAFKARGEVRHFAVAIGVFTVGGALYIPEAESSEPRGRDVDDGFGGVGEDGGATRDEVGTELSDEHEDGDTEAGTHGDAAEIARELG